MHDSPSSIISRIVELKISLEILKNSKFDTASVAEEMKIHVDESFKTLQIGEGILSKGSRGPR